ncbi:DUF2993 domain-containing protein [Cryobacterium algoritolerans]|uniref:DUF2993 domain-containing protein n=2 Tax=Cryobacterium algoritolerans TaxID=1259184 RepID=A0A4R8WT43_9MICO|nr:DUF2993 domain-containing protein [Cryobacterium algoritolerans]
MADRAARTRRRRGMSAIVIASLTVLGLIAAFFIVDAGARSYAEGRVKQEIADNLPDTVTGDVSVSIGGISVIAQYLSGSFERVALTAPALSVDGVAASVRVVATQVPIDKGKPVGDVRGVVDLDQSALNTLLRSSLAADAPDAKLALGSGEVHYAGSLSVLGFPIGYEAIATPTAVGDSLLFAPKSAKVTTGSGSIDAVEILPLIVGQKPVRVCVAKYLPEGVSLAGVNVTPERARITLESSSLLLTRKSLTTLGNCTAG